ncbi:MAG: phosphohydrolase, partial [Actinomycetota bacterium]
QDEELSSFISAADRVMEGLGYTEHGFRHANLTARIAFNVLSRVGFETHTANLACVAGYLHDVGNMISRYAHGQTGGVLVYQALHDRVPATDLAQIVAAIANHEEDNGYAVSPVSAAVILADKSDVHRSRVRTTGHIDLDIHDRVNYAVEQSFLRVDSAARTVSLELTIDTGISQVMEYFEIFLGRMQLCRVAAEHLGARFRLVVNGAELA